MEGSVDNKRQLKVFDFINEFLFRSTVRGFYFENCVFIFKCMCVAIIEQLTRGDALMGLMEQMGIIGIN